MHIAFLKNITDDRTGGLHSGRPTGYHSSGMTLSFAVRVRDMLIIHQASRPLKAIMFPPEPVTPGSLPTHSVRRSHRLSSDPIARNTVDSTDIAGCTLGVGSIGELDTG
ncbi:hypothetical protein N7530_008716 [Penicillium desertorum]|uniref:Uncharacterized protein n=1 Tax=Penicillium desertorum TaxID=1303715 RepID=A0A9W9WPS8_9EURO|nr:hypothetical protein N7530_008716 [Penicillium desertorum]